MSALRIRQMCSLDVEEAMRLKDAEFWNQTEADWGFFMDSNPELCLVACLGNKVVGTVTAINYENDIAWIGMMLVSSKHRRKGVGLKLLHSIIDRLTGSDSIGLDATPVGAFMYQRLGFKETSGLVRMSTQEMATGGFESYVGRVKPIEESDIPEVCRLDEAVFGADRSDLIQHLVGSAPSLCWLARRHGEISGFSLGRRGTRFTQLGPVVAKSLEDAKALVAQVSRELEGGSAVVDVPAGASEWQSWLQKLGFSQQRTLSRMYLKRSLGSLKSDTQYAICGPEFG